MAKPAPNFRIRQLWAYLSVDPADNSEGVIGMCGPDGRWIAFVCADEARARSLRPRALEIARQTRTQVRLARFTVREDVETIGGGE